MIILLSKQFEKSYKKLPDHIKVRFQQRRNIFWNNPNHPSLRNHPLVGKLSGYRSIDITGDYRVIYKRLENDVYVFALIGTHSQLY